jgi:hypothetical protein
MNRINYLKKKIRAEEAFDDISESGNIKTMLNYLKNDISKKPRSFKIGIFSIFLVIGFLASV